MLDIAVGGPVCAYALALSKCGDISAMGVCGGKGIACLGARGDKGKPATPALGDKGIEFATPTGARGMGELGGRSPGLGLMGSPGLSKPDGAVKFRCMACCASVTARLRRSAAGSAVGAKICGCWRMESLGSSSAVVRPCEGTGNAAAFSLGRL